MILLLHYKYFTYYSHFIDINISFILKLMQLYKVIYNIVYILIYAIYRMYIYHMINKRISRTRNILVNLLKLKTSRYF